MSGLSHFVKPGLVMCNSLQSVCSDEEMLRMTEETNEKTANQENPILFPRVSGYSFTHLWLLQIH